MKKFILLQLLFCVFSMSANQVISQNIYAAAADQNIYVINPTSCAVSLLCNGGLLSDIAFEGGNFYGAISGVIYKIDTITGLRTLVWQSDNDFNALTGDGNGHLYTASSKIYKYDIAANTYSLIGDVGYQSEGDLAFKDGKLYMMGHGQVLIRINLNPFSFSVLGSLNLGGYPSYGLTTFSNNNSTILCASALYPSNTIGFGSNRLFKIDEQNLSTTLICTEILNIFDGYINGLTSNTENPAGTFVLESNKIFSVYPNPANKNITIERKENKTEKFILSLRNVQGKLLLLQNIEFSNSYNLDIDLISNGIYVLTLENEKVQMRKKVVVQK